MTEPLQDLRNALDRAYKMAREAELELVMHPDDVTDAIREEVELTPLTKLRESTLVEPGTVFLIRPGQLGFDLPRRTE